ncbi:hypothetical protein M513_00940 [Trichuris suis]|uniref:Uncharacterized protein n=1 Tax=Trichuris suis TaxID=68888 RepID=A0A085MLT1_9BILA|nr:hypothetical protein M513_00940 [Trichuris suis]
MSENAVYEDALYEDHLDVFTQTSSLFMRAPRERASLGFGGLQELLGTSRQTRRNDKKRFNIQVAIADVQGRRCPAKRYTDPFMVAESRATANGITANAVTQPNLDYPTLRNPVVCVHTQDTNVTRPIFYFSNQLVIVADGSMELNSLLPNATPLIELLNQRMIKNLKLLYRKHLLRHLLSSVDQNVRSMSDFIKRGFKGLLFCDSVPAVARARPLTGAGMFATGVFPRKGHQYLHRPPPESTEGR